MCTMYREVGLGLRRGQKTTGYPTAVLLFFSLSFFFYFFKKKRNLENRKVRILSGRQSSSLSEIHGVVPRHSPEIPARSYCRCRPRHDKVRREYLPDGPLSHSRSIPSSRELPPEFHVHPTSGGSLLGGYATPPTRSPHRIHPQKRAVAMQLGRTLPPN